MFYRWWDLRAANQCLYLLVCGEQFAVEEAASCWATFELHNKFVSLLSSTLGRKLHQFFFFHVALNSCHSRYGNKTESFCAYLLLLCKVHIIFSHENEPFWLKMTNVEFIASGFYTVCPASRSVKLLPVPSRFLCPFHARLNNLF